MKETSYSSKNSISAHQRVSYEKFEATCTDGQILKGQLIIPENPKALIQFNGGTATKKEFYRPFLNFLAQEGYLACLWDYRGSGESAPSDLKKCSAKFRDYGQKDMPCIKAYLQQRFPELPFIIFGHSVGGQQVGFMPDLEGIQGQVNFAVSCGYLPHMPLSYRLKSNFFFYIFTPISNFLYGYLKAKKFNLMENLPKKVVLEWKAWCEKKDYFFDPKFMGTSVPEGHFLDFPFPIHTFWTEDDTISGARNTEVFWSHIKSQKEISFTRLSPATLGCGAIGHFGFFKKEMKDILWPMALEKLEHFLAAS